ncbi:MAG: PdaC/SigV domain-containing protein [Phenylobacterium sp.]
MRLPGPGRTLAAAFALLIVAATPAPTSGGVEVKTADYTFSYRWPAAVEAIPALRARLNTEQAGLRRDLARNAAEWREDVAADPDLHPYRRFVPYLFSAEWKVVATLPGWLSLSQQVSVFEGGAHPNQGFDSLAWDRAAGVARRPLDLFVSAAALDAAVRAPFCDALDAQRAKRRGEPVNRQSGEEFDACIAPSEQTVILGSSNRKTFNRIGILVAPYAAGPYVEGSYDVTVPVTPAVLQAVKPEFRAAFGP